MKLARLAAAAAIPVLSIIGFADSASAAGSIVITPANPIPAAGAPGATVAGTGFTPGDVLILSQCVDAARQAGGAAFNPLTDCEPSLGGAINFGDAVPASGVFTASYDIASGNILPVSSGGVGIVCDDTHPCRLRVSVGTFDTTAGQVFAPLTFAAPVVVTTTTTVAAATTTTVVPGTDVPESPLPIMLPIGAAAVLGAGYMMLRKGRNSSINA
jgi:hypothetical protein